MTPSEINRAIAEALGWQWKDTAIRKPSLVLDTKIVWEKRWHDPNGEVWMSAPNYFGDLNAINKAEQSLSPGNSWNYIRALKAVILEKTSLRSEGHVGEFYLIALSTAPQRCEAFLKTIGKWKEAPMG